jgi:hypothetical protein
MTAVFAGFIALIALIVTASMNMSSISESYQQIVDAYNSQGVNITYNSASIIGIFALCGTVLWLFGIGMGAGIGALGGLLGRSQSTVVPPPVPVYPGYPPYGYGQPPMQPPFYPPYTMPPYQNQPPQPPSGSEPPYQNQPPYPPYQ